MVHRQMKRAAWILGAVFAALLFFAGGAALRLLMGPVSLGPLAGAIEDSLNHSVSGLVIRFDQAVLEWSRTDSRINLIVLGTRIMDLDGRIVAQAPKADLDFDASEFILGHLSLKRLSLVGVQLTGVRSKDGALKLGFGNGQGAPDIIETLRNALNNNAQAGGGTLQSFTMRDARLAFNDETSGLFIVSPDLTFTLEKKQGRMRASLAAAVEISGAAARIVGQAAIRDNGIPEHIQLDVRGLSLPALAENSQVFETLRAYRLLSDLNTDLALDESGNIQTADFRAGATGHIDSPAFEVPLDIGKLEIKGRYDANANHVAVDSVSLDGKQIAGHAKADFQLAWNDRTLTSVAADVIAPDLKVDLPSLLRQPLGLSKLAVKASYDFAEHKIAWQHASFRLGSGGADFSGAAAFNTEKSPALKVSGTLDAFPVRELLKYWPSRVAQGAYGWIEENVPEGRVGPARFAFDFPAGLLDQDVLPDEALSVSFPFEGATLRYMDDLTPITHARGEALLLGSTFHATVAEGRIGPIAVGKGDIVVNAIHTRGPPGIITAHGEGKVADVLALIDQGSLRYPTQLGIDPKATSGQASVDVRFVIPMRRDVTFEEIDVGVTASTKELSVPIDNRRRLEHAAVIFDVDSGSLLSQGSGMIVGVPVTFAWSENFGGTGDTTHIDLNTTLDKKARLDLGYMGPDWLQGSIPLRATLTGRRFHFTDARIDADLTNATAEFEAVNLSKPEGLPASAVGSARFGDDGSISVTDFSVSGQDLQVAGKFLLAPDGALQNVSLSQVKAGAANDFSLSAEALPEAGYDTHIEGKSLDASRLFGDVTRKGKPSPEPAKSPGLNDPLSLAVKLDKLVLRDDLALSNVSFAIALGANERLETLTAEASGPGKGKVTSRLETRNGARSVTVDADDAGELIHSLTGLASIRGGSLSIRVAFPSDTPPKPPRVNAVGNPYTGSVTLSNIVVTNQPFMARLFAAGSLDGPLRLLRGEGIQVTKFEAPFTLRGKTVAIHDGRFSGPSVGASFEGTIDRGTDKVNVTGTLVPAYGLNGMLGVVPVLGDLLVSKKGEGIFGLTYAMRGDLDEPSLKVNPLSMLTPGIFRRIFEFSAPKQPAEAENVPPHGARVQ